MEWNLKSIFVYVGTLITWNALVFWIFQPSIEVAVVLFVAFAILMKMEMTISAKKRRLE
jgi:hypothetical protein